MVMDKEKIDEVTTQADLAAAFKPEEKSRKNIISLIVMIVGILALIAGVVFLVLNLLRGAGLQDGEYLISAKEWVLGGDTNCAPSEETNCAPAVIWKFTEIGKGTLTTNGHVNDYDFIWALEGGKLKIETNWLYAINNEYDYKLDQGAGTLTLTSGDETVVLQAQFENK